MQANLVSLNGFGIGPPSKAMTLQPHMTPFEASTLHMTVLTTLIIYINIYIKSVAWESSITPRATCVMNIPAT